MVLYPIRDSAELSVIEALKVGMVKEPVHLCLSWLRSNHWVVVPVESASHFDREQTERLSAGFAAVNCPTVFAIATEDIGHVSGPKQPGFPDTSGYSLDTSPQGLWEFSELCSHFNFVLIPADRSAAVLCTVNDYYLVAGPSAFVKPAVGGDIEAAWVQFREYAADPCWDGRLQACVVPRYDEFR